MFAGIIEMHHVCRKIFRNSAPSGKNPVDAQAPSDLQDDAIRLNNRTKTLLQKAAFFLKS